MKLKSILAVALAACLGFMATSAEAALIYGFSGITNNNATNRAIGAAQLKVEMIDVGWGGQVRFEFTNTGASACSLTDIYFHDSTNLITQFGWIQNYSGTNFRMGATPSTLTGGSAVGFVTDQILNTESSSIAYGVNPGEKVAIIVNMRASTLFSDMITAITNQTVRIGVTAMGFNLGGQESFVNGTTNIAPVPVTPEPSAMALGGIAIAGLFLKRRKRM